MPRPIDRFVPASLRSLFRRAPRRKPIRGRGTGNTILRFEPLESRTVLSGDPFSVQSIIDAYNTGVSVLRQSQQVDAVTQSINEAFGTDLPLIQNTLADIINAVDDLVAPFQNSISLGGGSTLQDLENWLTSNGFTIEYAGISEEAGTHDLLRVHWGYLVDPISTIEAGGDPMFSYLTDNVDGELDGEIDANPGTSYVSMTFGVDVVNGTPTFFLSEGSGLNIGGLSAQGELGGNLGIGFLLNVNVSAGLNLAANGDLTFQDSDGDQKLRLGTDLSAANLADRLTGSFTGTLTLNAGFTADLPVIPDLNWGMVFTATLSTAGVSYQVSDPTLPSLGSVQDGVRNAGQTALDGFDLFGGSGGILGSNSFLGSSGVGALGVSSLGGMLGISSLLNGIDFQFATPVISQETLLAMIRGERVDLLQMEPIKGGETYSVEDNYELAYLPFQLGPIPADVRVEGELGYEVGYKYQVQFGVDTVGVYIDPRTYFRAWGGAFAGIEGSLNVAYILKVASLQGGLGIRLSADISLHDPDASDGRIYLDEIIKTQKDEQGNDLAPDLGAAFLHVLDVMLGGEAYGYARGTINLPWPIPDITLFDKHWQIASFSESIGGQNQVHDAPGSYAKDRTRQVPSDVPLPEHWLQGGVLTLNGTQNIDGSPRALANTISVRNVDGGIQVNWRGVGKRTYAGSSLTQIVFTGNDADDYVSIAEDVDIGLWATGGAGDDFLKGGMRANTIDGGSDNDRIYGGDAADNLSGDTGNDLIRGGGDNDVISGGVGSDDLYGDDGHDTIDGGTEADAIDGGSGNDTILGQAGKDFLTGGLGNDSLDGGTGEDHLFGNAGQDVLRGNGDNDVLLGGQDNDTLLGEAGDDLLIGDSGASGGDVEFGVLETGDDLLHGGAGHDTLLGGAGGDTLFGDDGDDLGNDLLYGDEDNDYLYGGSNQAASVQGGQGADILIGGTGADYLKGERGPDQLSGGAGVDSVYGGYGDDLLLLEFSGVSGAVEDLLDGGVDQDILAVQGRAEVDYQPDPENPGKSFAIFDDNFNDVIELAQISDFQFQAISRAFVGGPITDSFTFTLDSSTEGNIERLGLFGLGGNDHLSVRGQGAMLFVKNAIIDGGTGNDTLIGGEGRDSIVGGEGHDTLEGLGASDVLQGGDGRDLLDGGADSDILYGGDEISGDGQVDDTILGGAGRDFVYAGSGDDLVLAGDGIFGDYILGEGGNDTLIGGDGLDRLDGGTGADVILGGELGDVLNGEAGADTLVGEFGKDTLAGGDHADDIWVDENNAIRAAIAAALGINLPPLVPMTEPEIEAYEDELQVDESVLEKLEDITDGLTADLTTQYGFSALEAAFLQLVFTQPGALVDDQWSALQDLLLVRGHVTQAEWERLVDVASGGQFGTQNHIRSKVETAYDYTLELIQNQLFESIFSTNTADGGDGGDSIHGGNSPDFINGGEGDDSIFHSAGMDTIFGGNGDNDIYWVAGTNQADEIEAEALTVDSNHVTRVTVRDRVTEAILVTGDLDEIDIETIGVLGLGGNDVITVNFGNQAVKKVFIDGGTGDDSIEASDVFDETQVVALQAKATLVGGAGDDTIHGGLSDDVIEGGAGEDVLHGEGTSLVMGGEDTIRGQAGDDRLYGAFGNDLLEGGDGDDGLYGQGGNDVLKGEADHDLVQGGDGNDTIEGGDGHDHLYGNGHNDTIYGGIGADVLDGGAGNDFLDGDESATPYDGALDILIGGLGSDIFQYGEIADRYAGSEDADGNDSDRLIYPAAYIIDYYDGAVVQPANMILWVFETSIGVFDPSILPGYHQAIAFMPLHGLGGGFVTGMDQIDIDTNGDVSIEVHRAAGPSVSEFGYFTGDVLRNGQGASDRGWIPHGDDWMGPQTGRGWSFRYANGADPAVAADFPMTWNGSAWVHNSAQIRPDDNRTGSPESYIYSLTVDMDARYTFSGSIQKYIDGGDGFYIKSHRLRAGGGPAIFLPMSGGAIDGYLDFSGGDTAVRNFIHGGVGSSYAGQGDRITFWVAPKDNNVNDKAILHNLHIRFARDPELGINETPVIPNTPPSFLGPSDIFVNAVPGQSLAPIILSASDGQTDSERLFYYLLTDETPLDVRVNPVTGEVSIGVPENLASGDYTIEFGVADDDMDFNMVASESKTIVVHVQRLAVDAVVGETVFADDFATFEDGNLIGQNGWTGDPAQTLPIINGVLDGQILPSGSPPIFIAASKPFTLPAAWEVATASFQVKAFNETANGFFKSNGDFFGFSGTAGVGALWTAGFDQGGVSGNPVWTFDVRGLTGNENAVFNVPRTSSSSGEFVDLRIHIDRETLQVYGSYDLGEGVQTTASFAITPERLALIDSIAVIFDTRSRDSYRGVQIRHMELQAVTSPADSNLFNDSFATFDEGNIVGQNGWQGDPAQTLPIVDGVLDGQASPVGSPPNFIAASKSFTLPAAWEVATASFQVKAFNETANGFFKSNGDFFGFSGTAGVGLLWTPGFDQGGVSGSPVWTFDARGLTGNENALFNVPRTSASSGEFVDLHLHVDRQTLQVYGSYDLGDGLQTTASFAITPDRLALIDSIAVVFDTRDREVYRGVQISGIGVSTRNRMEAPEGLPVTILADVDVLGFGVPSTYQYTWFVDNVEQTSQTGSSFALPGTPDQGTRVVRLEVRDDHDNAVYTDSVTVWFVNAPPTGSIAGPTSARVRGEPVTFTLSATDPSPVDQASPFTYRIDWDGNGSVDQTVVGVSGTQVTHVFANSGSYNVRVTATDKDGGQSPVAMHSVNVVNWTLRQDPNNASKTDLIWGGTNGFDAYYFIFPGLVLIQAQNNAFFGSPQPVSTGGFNGKVYVYAQGSGDLIFADVMSASMVIDGGDGDDVLIGGRGADSILGGNGNDIIFGGTLESDAGDTLEGGSGDDLLVGHYGADVLKGGTGQDLLVAGRLFFNDLPSAVFGIQAEWLSGRPIAERVANLSSTGTGDRNNGDIFLLPGSTVLDDSPTGPAVIDQVFGEADDDWLLFDFSDDIAPDAGVGDVLTNLA